MPSRREIRLRRIYDDRDDGCRVLVDRLWPRGMSKAEADVNEWLQDVAPSTALRRWYGHDVSRFYANATRIARIDDLGPALSAKLVSLLGSN